MILARKREALSIFRELGLAERMGPHTEMCLARAGEIA
ncbi:unnamed protein product, partial [marine sediment metagenome]